MSYIPLIRMKFIFENRQIRSLCTPGYYYILEDASYSIFGALKIVVFAPQSIIFKYSSVSRDPATKSIVLLQCDMRPYQLQRKGKKQVDPTKDSSAS